MRIFLKYFLKLIFAFVAFFADVETVDLKMLLSWSN